MRITIDPEGAEYTVYELMKLSADIQEAWTRMGRGMVEVYTMNFKNAKLSDNVPNQENQMLNANPGDI